MYVSLFLLHCA